MNYHSQFVILNQPVFLENNIYPEIVANEEQRDEWVKLFAIDKIKATGKTLITPANPGYSKPLTVEFLKANDKLVLDTQRQW